MKTFDFPEEWKIPKTASSATEESSMEKLTSSTSAANIAFEDVKHYDIPMRPVFTFDRYTVVAIDLQLSPENGWDEYAERGLAEGADKAFAVRVSFDGQSVGFKTIADFWAAIQPAVSEAPKP